ncbi:MAG: nitroreductase family protein [Clostridia bacterium]|nr:nitroreductase family protein [Clostridia bacterium]
MNTLEAIYSRRSIRAFNGVQLTEEECKVILKAAYASPIGRAMYDTLSLTVITDRALIDRWEKQMQEEAGNPDLHPFYGAPTVILVSSVIGEGLMTNVNYSNAAIVVQNMAIAATEIGVGACHIWGAVRGLHGDDAVSKELKIPAGMVPCCAIALGHFDGEYAVREVQEDRIQTYFIR